MYDPRKQYQMPIGISPIPQLFLNDFFGSFLPEKANSHHECLERINQSCDTILYLIQMIYEGMVIGNPDFSKMLNLTVPYLAKILSNEAFKIKTLNETYTELPNSFVADNILFLLPYAAQIFQNTNEINLFNILISALFEFTIPDTETSYLFNGYITFLLENEQKTLHHIIISMRLAGKLSAFNISPENHELLLKGIIQSLENLPQCNMDDNIYRLLFIFIFSKIKNHIHIYILESKIPIDFFKKTIINYIDNLVKKGSECNKNQIIFNLGNNIQIINEILRFLTFFWEKIPASFTNLIPHLKMILYYFYRRGFYISKYSNFLCSYYIISFICKNIQYLQLSLTESELKYFVAFIDVFSALSSSDIENIIESQELFFFDHFEVDLHEKHFFSRRQCAAKLLQILLQYKIDFIAAIIKSLFNAKDRIREFNIFILSQILRIYTEIQGPLILLEDLHALTINYILFLSDKVRDSLRNPNCLQNLNINIHIISYYYLISQSFGILSDEEVAIFNQEIANIHSVLLKVSNVQFHSILFTLLCSITYQLFYRNMLDESIQQQILGFIASYMPFCLTNHASDFIAEYSFKSENLQLLLQVLDNYLIQCDEHAQNISSTPNCQDIGNGKIEISEKVKESKEYVYKDSIFIKKLDQIENIIGILNHHKLDQPVLYSLVNFLIYYGDDWTFRENMISLMSVIFQKSETFTDWTKFYLDNLSLAGRNIYYGEWVVPLIHLISYRFNEINEDNFNFILEKLILHCNMILEKDSDVFITTVDAVWFFNLMTRMFEVAFIKRFDIHQEALQYFCNISEAKPNEPDSEDFDPLNQTIGEIMLKLSAILAGLPMQIEVLLALLDNMVMRNLIINNELRFLVVIIIDNFINDGTNPNVIILRKMCIENTIPKDIYFLQNYMSSPSFLQQVPHPMYTGHPIEGFISE